MVFGGMYGPTFGSGDKIGCGMVPVGGNNSEVAIYFSRNGVCLPAVKFNMSGILVFPIVSMKGKLCHIELLKSSSMFAFNTIQEHSEA
jgi:hypothetical protein